MLFNSAEYILLFLPLVAWVYFRLTAATATNAARVWLVVASLFFYSWWNPVYLPLILGSIAVNFGIGHLLQRRMAGTESRRKPILAAGIAFNLGLLGYFKYVDFFIANANRVFGAEVPALNVVLPLAISFFTFTQIAYLVDMYQRKAEEGSLVNYSLFVLFFPHLIAGPIVHHREMMPQFAAEDNKRLNWNNISTGLFLFSIGLFKKVIVADTFSVWASSGYSAPESLSLLDSWATTLSYTFQLYFDFSGYTDMALGAARMFNIRLPENFNSPYKALSIQDFWRRWHMTLSRFLRDYVYFPLGGNRVAGSRTYANLFLTFLLGGLWHGAGWTFVIWGAMHGAAAVVYRIWNRLGLCLPRGLAWFTTFLFVHLGWVFFRAESLADAISVLGAMVGMNGVGFSRDLAAALGRAGMPVSNDWIIFRGFLAVPESAFLWIAVALYVVVKMPNSTELVMEGRPRSLKLDWRWACVNTVVLTAAMCGVLMSRGTEFLYFDF